MSGFVLVLLCECIECMCTCIYVYMYSCVYVWSYVYIIFFFIYLASYLHLCGVDHNISTLMFSSLTQVLMNLNCVHESNGMDNNSFCVFFIRLKCSKRRVRKIRWKLGAIVSYFFVIKIFHTTFYFA